MVVPEAEGIRRGWSKGRALAACAACAACVEGPGPASADGGAGCVSPKTPIRLNELAKPLISVKLGMKEGMIEWCWKDDG